MISASSRLQLLPGSLKFKVRCWTFVVRQRKVFSSSANFTVGRVRPGEPSTNRQREACNCRLSRTLRPTFFCLIVPTLFRKHAVRWGAHAGGVLSSPAQRRLFARNFRDSIQCEPNTIRKAFGEPPNTAGQRPALPIRLHRSFFQLRVLRVFRGPQ